MKWSLGFDATRERFGRGRAAIPLGIAPVIGVPLVLAAGDSSVGAVTREPAGVPGQPGGVSRTETSSPSRVSPTMPAEPGKIEVTRPGVGVVGSAIGVVSGGDVAFEINHPGGYCWGAGTGLNVTPDIQAGDVVSLSFNGIRGAATTTLDIFANDAVQTGTTVTVTGHIGKGVVHDQHRAAHHRAGTGRHRDRQARRARRSRATHAGPKGGYSSGLAFGVGDQKFTATYIFDNESDATIAANAGLGERAMAWEFIDPAGNRQGMTIAENGEPGGPGMGGCPNGPLQSGPPAPTNVAAVNVANNMHQGQLDAGRGAPGHSGDPRVPGDGGCPDLDQQRTGRDRPADHEPGLPAARPSPGSRRVRATTSTSCRSAALARPSRPRTRFRPPMSRHRRFRRLPPAGVIRPLSR